MRTHPALAAFAFAVIIVGPIAVYVFVRVPDNTAGDLAVSGVAFVLAFVAMWVMIRRLPVEPPTDRR